MAYPFPSCFHSSAYKYSYNNIFCNDMDSPVEESNDYVLDISLLPNEVFLKIFGYLTQNQLGQIARVCKRWNVLTKSAILWKKVTVEFSPSHGSQTTVTKDFIKMLPACVTSIKLHFTMIHSFWTESFSFEEFSVRLKETCPVLEMLNLRFAKLSCSLPSVINLCTLFLPSLKRLVLHSSSFDDYLVIKECDGNSKIVVLDVSYCFSYTEFEYFIKPQFSKMPYLKQLCLSHTAVDDSWFEDYFLDPYFLNQLHVLDMGYTSIGSRTFRTICNHGHHLKELYLCCFLYLRDNDLNLNNSVFPDLRTICLRGCWGVTCEGVVSLTQSCPHLQNFYVGKEVAESYLDHPFVTANDYRFGIIKIIEHCYEHCKKDYLCN